MGKPLPSVCGSVTDGFWVSGWDCAGLAWFINAGGALRALGPGAVSSVLPHPTHSPTQREGGEKQLEAGGLSSLDSLCPEYAKFHKIALIYPLTHIM